MTEQHAGAVGLGGGDGTDKQAEVVNEVVEPAEGGTATFAAAVAAVVEGDDGITAADQIGDEGGVAAGVLGVAVASTTTARGGRVPSGRQETVLRRRLPAPIRWPRCSIMGAP